MMNLRRNIVILIISILLILFIFFSGCTSNNSERYYTKNNLDLENIELIAPKKAYFDEPVEFDIALNSDNSKITSYQWNFQDGTVKTGKNIKHEYTLSNDFQVEFPIIYTVTLYIKYQDDSIGIKNHRISVYPSYFQFYFKKNNLTETAGSQYLEKISEEDFSFIDNKELSYNLDKAVYLDKCSWNVTLYFEKPLFSNIKDINLLFYNDKGDLIQEKKADIGLINIGKRKTIYLSGQIKEETNLKSLRLVVSSFSLKNDIYLIYGGEKSSNILFSFS